MQVQMDQFLGNGQQHLEEYIDYSNLCPDGDLKTIIDIKDETYNWDANFTNVAKRELQNITNNREINYSQQSPPTPNLINGPATITTATNSLGMLQSFTNIFPFRPLQNEQLDTSQINHCAVRQPTFPQRNYTSVEKILQCDECKTVFYTAVQFLEHQCIYRTEHFNAKYDERDHVKTLRQAVNINNPENFNSSAEMPLRPNIPIAYLNLIDEHQQETRCNQYGGLRNSLKNHDHVRAMAQGVHVKNCERVFSYPEIAIRHKAENAIVDLTEEQEQPETCSNQNGGFRNNSKNRGHVGALPQGVYLKNRAHIRSSESQYCIPNAIIDLTDEHQPESCSNQIINQDGDGELRSSLKNARKKYSKKKKPKQKQDHCCPICNVKFTKEGYVNTHMKMHTNPSNLLYCEICKKAFANEYNLINHKRLHTGEKPHECLVCAETFVFSGRLQIHLRIHEKEGEENPFKCKLCSKGFDFYNTLREHKRVVHDGEDPFPFKCKICELTFATMSNANQHQRYHAPRKKIQCDLCNKVLSKGMYKEHLRIHTGEKPYTCKVCKKSFRLLEVLQRHSNVHSGADHSKRFSCSVCKKSFTNRVNEKRHRRVHTGDVSFECKACKKSFSQTCSLKRHERLHCEKRKKSTLENVQNEKSSCN